MPTTTTGVRGNYAPGIATRKEIVRVARDVLVERGFHGMTVTAVAERSGLTRAGLIHHFASKEHLLLAVMDDRFEENWEWISNLTKQGTDILEAHVELMRRYTQSPAEVALHVSLAGASIDVAHPAHNWCTKRYAFLRQALGAQVAADQSAGYIESDQDPETVATHLIALTEGIMMHWLHSPEHFDAVAAMRGSMQALRAKPGAG